MLIHEIQKGEVISKISLCLEHLQIKAFLHAVMGQKVKAGMTSHRKLSLPHLVIQDFKSW